MSESIWCEEPNAVSAMDDRRLDAYLDEAEDLEEREREAGVPEDVVQTRLAGMLARRPIVPYDMGSLRRVYRLWLRVGEFAAALAAIDKRGAALLADLPAGERESARLSLAFWRIDALKAQGDPAALGRAVAETAHLLAALPRDGQSDDAWGYLADLAEGVGDQACFRLCSANRHALLTQEPARARFRAWDDAVLAVRRGRSYAAEGLADQARSSAFSAIDFLKRASADQEVDHDDWLRLGESLVLLVPESLAGIQEEVRAHLVAGNCSPARRREVEVQLARLEAKSLYRQGRLDAALEKSVEGRYWLSSDEDDAFSAQVLDWLLEAGCRPAAARLAFESVFNERAESAAHACRLAEQHVRQASSADDAYWALALAAGAVAEDTQWVTEGDDPESSFCRHLDLARRLADSPNGGPGGDPAMLLLLADGLQAIHWVQANADYARALPILEAAVLLPELATPAGIEALWLCRMQVHGVERALSLPYMDAAAAGWCYNVGVALNYSLRERLPEGAAWPEERVDELAARYYESGLLKYENFIVRGVGLFCDADKHVYSMLCNNLGIHCRSERKDYGKAILLHGKGIDASPFAEHYDGLMWSFYQAGRFEEFVAAADRLWHFVADYGYGRHSPTDYIGNVSSKLEELGRDGEIAIWLQRLDEWWGALEPDERADVESDYVYALLVVLSDMAVTQPEDTLLRLEQSLAVIRAVASPGYHQSAAILFNMTGAPDRALALYREAIAILDGEGAERDEELRKTMRDEMSRIEAGLRPRPWWKFWA